MEVSALGGSDVKPLSITNVESFEDKIIHRTISFDGGKFQIMVTNNDEGWDAVVKAMNKEGEVMGSSRTYGGPQDIELNPGIYDISFTALNMKGEETTFLMEDQIIEAAGVTEVSHDLKSGTAFINSRADNKTIDSTVNFKKINSGKNVAAGRTYTSGKEFLLNPGTYEVIVRPLGAYKDRKAQTFTINLKQGDNLKKEVTF